MPHIGALKIQYQEHAITYASRSFTSAEKKYSITEQECLTVVWATSYWDQYLLDLKVSDNNVNSEVTTVTQRSTSVETIDSKYQVERNITSTAEGEDINTNLRNLSTPMFNKGGNSNKFQMKAWTDEKEASKSLRKINGPFKAPKEDRDRAAQIEAALKKCNPDILDRINRGKSALENEKQMDNPFDTNRDKPNADNITKDIEDSESSLSSRMASPNSGQYSSRLLGKKPMLMKANQKKR
ncbi:hypothetical protein G9A89_015645 [Geosiphon pyriformis]|nr:hypothetical protein G9A89_015645 [Geosiphon pyriformis]